MARQGSADSALRKTTAAPGREAAKPAPVRSVAEALKELPSESTTSSAFMAARRKDVLALLTGIEGELRKQKSSPAFIENNPEILEEVKRLSAEEAALNERITTLSGRIKDAEQRETAAKERTRGDEGDKKSNVTDILTMLGKGVGIRPKDKVALEAAAADGSLDTAVQDETGKMRDLIQHPEKIASAGFDVQAKVAAEFAAKIVETLERTPVEQRQLAITKLVQRVKEKRWKNTNKVSLERLQFLVDESKRIADDLEKENVVIPHGVSQVFAKKGAGEIAANANYIGSTMLRVGVTGLEFGVSATGFMSLMKAAGMQVEQWSAQHFIALGAAAVLVPVIEYFKGTAISSFAEKKPVTFSLLASAAAASLLPLGNSATFAVTFDSSGQAADTVKAMQRAISVIQSDLEKVRVHESGGESELQKTVNDMQEFFEGMISDEANGAGGKGGHGAGPETAIKEGITGIHNVPVPETVTARPDVQEAIKSARDRINARMLELGPQYALQENESIPDALKRYLALFSQDSTHDFETLEGYKDAHHEVAGQYADLLALGRELEHNAEPIPAKMTTITGAATKGNPDLLLQEQNIHKSVADLVLRFHQEVDTPMHALLEAVSKEMNRLGDPKPIQIAIPEFNPNRGLGLLDQVPMPKSRGINDAAMWESILVDKLGDKGVWVILFTLFAFSGMGWNLAQASRLHKKQSSISEGKAHELAGDDDKQGIEIAYAAKTAEAFAGKLAATDGLLRSEGIQKLLPFGADMSWFQLSPLEVMAAWREGARRANKNLDVETKKGPVAVAREVYSNGLKEIITLVPESEEVKALNQYLELLESDERRTLAVEQAALPGLTKIFGMAAELADIARAGTSKEMAPLYAARVREFQAGVLKMSFDHIAFRSRIAQTNVSLLNTMYEDLRKSGEFKDLDVVGLTELPKDISVDLLSDEDLPESLTSELLRGSALRSVTIEALDRHLRAEQGKLEKMQERLQLLVDALNLLPGQAGATDPSFRERAAKAQAELQLARAAFKEHPDEKLNVLTSRKALRDLLLKDVRSTTRNRMKDRKDDDSESYDAREQIKAMRDAVSSYDGEMIIPGYKAEVRLERKARDKESVADYLAFVVRFKRDGEDSRDVLLTQEFPLLSVLGKGMSPDKAAETITQWIEGRAPAALLAQKHDEAKRSIEKTITSFTSTIRGYKNGTLANIRVGSRGGANQVAEFYETTLPARHKNLALSELRNEIEKSKQDFETRAAKRFTPAEFSAISKQLQIISSEAGKIADYNYNFSPRKDAVLSALDDASRIKNVRITFKPYDPMRIGTDQEELFVIENAGMLSRFQGKERTHTASLEQLQTALSRNPSDYQSLSKALPN